MYKRQDYTCVNEDAFYDEYKNVEGNLTRFDTVPSVIMVNTELIGDIEINGYEDLLNPELKEKIAFADPAASSSSFEHLVNTVSYTHLDVYKRQIYSILTRLVGNLAKYSYYTTYFTFTCFNSHCHVE